MPEFNPGLDSVTVDVDLKRGIWVEGKLMSKATGELLPRFNIQYFAAVNNPSLKELIGPDGTTLSTHVTYVRDDGAYRVAALPGQGFVAVQGGPFLTLDQQPGSTPQWFNHPRR